MHGAPFQTTEYFRAMRTRPDREIIRDEWIRRWTAVPESGGRVLRVILLPDGMTVHNAFFDRSFKP